MAAQEKPSFSDEMCKFLANVTEIGKIASSLKELHQADIHRAVSELTAKNRELKQLLQGTSLPYQVTEPEDFSDVSDFPPETGNVTRVPAPSLRDIGEVMTPPEQPMALDLQPMPKQSGRQPGTASTGSLDGEVMRSGPWLNPGMTATSGNLVIAGIRKEWDDANHESMASLDEKCSVQIIWDCHASKYRPLFSRTMTGKLATSRFGGDKAPVCMNCLDNTFMLLCGIVHPVGQFRFFWNVICLMFIAYDLFAVPMQAFDIDDTTAFYSLEWILAIWWTLDVLMTFRTGYIVGSRVEMRPGKIAWNYTKTWLLCDILIVSLEWVNRFVAAFASASVLRSSRALRVLRFLKLVRVTKLQVFWKSLQDQVNSNVFQLLITMTILGAILLLTMHVTTCFWYFIGESRDDGWTSYDVYEGPRTKLFWYVASFRWVVSQFNGRTDMDDRRNMLERLLTCVVGVALAVIAEALFISVITKTMLDLSELVSEKTHRHRVVNEYLEMNPLPPMLISRVKRCVRDYQDSKKELQKEDEVLAILPKHVQTDVVYEVRSPVLTLHHFFHNLQIESPWVMRFVCRKVVQSVSASKDEVVFEEGHESDRMLFTDKISATYHADRLYLRKMQNGQEVCSDEIVYAASSKHKSNRSGTSLAVGGVSSLAAQIIPMGSWVSEAAVWIEWKNQGRLISNKHGILLGVQASTLAQALKKDPDAFALASLYAKNIASELLTLPPSKLSDILPFEVQLHSPLQIRITVVSAAGLRNADGFFMGKSDPYCVCKVVGLTGKANDVRFKTAVMNNCLDPTWNHSTEIVLSRHQLLEFQVWDSNYHKKHVNLGVARLSPSDFFPSGFEGDLDLLTDGGDAQGSLRIKIKLIETDALKRISLLKSNLSRFSKRNNAAH